MDTETLIPIAAFQDSISQREAAADAFVKRLGDMSRNNNIDLAIDSVIDRFDSLLTEGDFESCENIVRRSMLAIEFLDPAVSAAILSMTFVEKERLAAVCVPFYKSLFAFLKKTMSESEAASVLKGLD